MSARHLPPLKSKKMVSGIPTILCFVREFVVYPRRPVVGSSEKEINSFFEMPESV
jgi:hypothetical protein